MGLFAAMTHGRLPRWASILLGLVCVLVGASLVTRPFQSLTVLILLVAAGAIVTGLSDLADRSASPTPRTATVTGVGWIVLGVAVLLWPGLSLRTLTVVLGLALIAGGVARTLGALRGGTDARVAALLLGAAGVILGILALGWPDLTLLVTAVVFGVRVLVFGVLRLVDAFQRPQAESGERVAASPSRLRRSVQTLGAALALLLALLLVVVSLLLHADAPVVDAFYAAPAQIPARPGVLLRSEPFDRAIPVGARAWRILYTTTQADGVPALASGLVVAAERLPAGPRPVIAWAHGTTGVNQTCAPSLLADPFGAGAMPALDQVIANGWVLVATDYIGLGTAGPHAYLVGQPAGRAVLDAVRAARQLPELRLAPSTVVWGHSQGGGAALWTGILAPTYAPDANVIGVAALAPASDLPGLVSNLDVVPGGAIFAAYVIQGYTDTYPDVRFTDYVRPAARILVREIASRCLAQREVLASVLTSLVIDQTIQANDPAQGPFGARLAENVPRGPIPAPVLIGQGLGDQLVVPAAQAAYAQARCQAGGQLEYRTYPGLDHVGVVGPESPLVPELLQWSQERLDGRPARSTC